MTPLTWTHRAIIDVQSIRQFIAQDSSHYYAQLVTQRSIAAVECFPALPQFGHIVLEINDLTIREVIQGPHRIVYQLIHEEIHILTVHHAARLLHLQS